MEYRALGNSGVKVSSLCLGTMTFGDADEKSFMHQVGCDETTAFAIMNRALDAGINFLDTADVYGQDGLTERVIGGWFARDGRRDEVVLATKFRFRMGSGPNASGASRYRIVRAVEESLRRLQTDRIDLYQVHMQDVETPEEETLRALDDLVRAGKVLYLGASNYAAYRLADSLWISRTEHLARFVTLQAEYSLVVRDLEREHAPLCRHFGLGLLPWSPLAGGFLSGKYRRDEAPPDGSRLAKWNERFARHAGERGWRTVEALVAVAREVEATPAQVALAWLLQRPQVSSVIFGARSVAQVDDNLRAAALKLPAEVVKRLDEASAFELGYPYEFMSRVQKRW
ncbi:MAG: aldo/keto reductase [Myxococcales bacterium]|nr:aldo/keto reductase [Myxococcales bacterium]